MRGAVKQGCVGVPCQRGAQVHGCAAYMKQRWVQGMHAGHDVQIRSMCPLPGPARHFELRWWGTTVMTAADCSCTHTHTLHQQTNAARAKQVIHLQHTLRPHAHFTCTHTYTHAHTCCSAWSAAACASSSLLSAVSRASFSCARKSHDTHVRAKALGCAVQDNRLLPVHHSPAQAKP